MNVDAIAAAVGAELKKARKAARLHQSELARRTGIHRPNISRLERGRYVASLESIVRYCAAIGTPVGELIERALARVASSEAST